MCYDLSDVRQEVRDSELAPGRYYMHDELLEGLREVIATLWANRNSGSHRGAKRAMLRTTVALYRRKSNEAHSVCVSYFERNGE